MNHPEPQGPDMNIVPPSGDDAKPQVLLKTGTCPHDLAPLEVTAVTGPCVKGASARSRRLPVGAEVRPAGSSRRTVMLDLLVETLRLADRRSLQLSARQIAMEDADPDHGHLVEFRLEQGLPVWRFEPDGIVVERQALLLHRQNTAVLRWRD
jgi:hypothetical protein